MTDATAPAELAFMPSLLLLHLQVAMLFLARQHESHQAEWTFGLAVAFAGIMSMLAAWQLAAVLRHRRLGAALGLAGARFAFLASCAACWGIAASIVW